MAEVFNLLSSGGIGGIEVLCKSIGLRAEYPNRFAFLFKEGKIYDEMLAAGLDVISFAKVGKKKITLRKIKALIQEVNKSDIIVTHHANISLQLVYYILRKAIKGKQFVMTVHSCFDEELYFSYSSKIKNLLFEWLLQSNLKGSDGIIFVSEAGRRSYLQFFNIDKRKTIVIYNGVVIDDNCSLKNLTFQLHNPFRLLYIGRLVKEKGIHLLIEAVYQLNYEGYNTELIIIGDGDYRNKLEEQIKKYNLKNKIKLEGEQRNTKRFLYYTDGFVYPSICQEVFGLSIVEAMATGVPCIAFNVGGITEIIRDGKNGFIAKEKSANGLIDAIGKLRDFYAKNSIASMKQECITTAKKFAIDNTILKLDNYYSELITKNNQKKGKL